LPKNKSASALISPDKRWRDLTSVLATRRKVPKRPRGARVLELDVKFISLKVIPKAKFYNFLNIKKDTRFPECPRASFKFYNIVSPVCQLLHTLLQPCIPSRLSSTQDSVEPLFVKRRFGRSPVLLINRNYLILKHWLL